MEGKECNITFYEEGTEEVVGYLQAPFPPDVGDIVTVPREYDKTWEVTRRQFHWPSPGSMTHNSGGRYPILDIMVKPAERFFKE